MSSATRSISPIKPSSASVTTVSVSSPTSIGQFSNTGPSTTSSVSSPNFPPPGFAAGPPPGGAQALHHHLHHHHHHHHPPHHLHHNNYSINGGQNHGGQPPSSQGAAAAGAAGAPGSTNSSMRPRTSASPSTLPSPGEIRSISEARTALVASIGNMLDSELQSRAQLLHSNHAAIEKQKRDVEKAIVGLRKEDDKLAKVVADGSKKFKELGDVQNWAERLERDFLVLEETMRLVREGSGSGSESGSRWTGSWSGSRSGSEAGDEDGDLQMRDGVDESGGVAPLDKGKGNEVMPTEAMELDPTQVPLPPDDAHTFIEAGANVNSAIPQEPSNPLATSTKATGWRRFGLFK